MERYVIRRLVQVVPTFLALSILIFTLIRVLPGDAVAARMGESGRYSDEQVARLRAEWRLDDPAPVQYFSWLSEALRADFGESFITHRPVREELARALPVTVELTILSLGFAFLGGIPLGIISAARRNSRIDYISRVVSVVGISIPNFWLATLLIVVPALWLGYYPPLAFEDIQSAPIKNLQQMVPPALALSFLPLAVLARVTRSSMLEALREDYVRTAQSKGLPRMYIMTRHVLRNAAIPILTVAGVLGAQLIGGAVVIEQIFDLPGIGRLTLESIIKRDYPQLQANIVVIGMMVMLLNLTLDVIYVIVDPRLR